MMPPRGATGGNLEGEPAGGALTADQWHPSTKADHVKVDQRIAKLTECTPDQPPLYASGISWIDRAYNVIRQLRHDHGLPDIRPLAEPPTQSTSRAIATSVADENPVQRQPRVHRTESSIQQP
jgi:hypothetical protein